MEVKNLILVSTYLSCGDLLVTLLFRHVDWRHVAKYVTFPVFAFFFSEFPVIPHRSNPPDYTVPCCHIIALRARTPTPPPPSLTC